MRCRHCGRALTYRRIGEDSALVVCRTGEEDVPYCGPCVDADRVEVHEGDTLLVLLGDSRGTFRARRLYPEVL